LFWKNKGEIERYWVWLFGQLKVLEKYSARALALQQFEHLHDSDNPNLFAIRHPHSQLNQRYIYIYIDNEAAVLLTAFKEQKSADYARAMLRA
jgi:hypothetical protein